MFGQQFYAYTNGLSWTEHKLMQIGFLSPKGINSLIGELLTLNIYFVTVNSASR